ncbi:MAG: hypothetical protein ACFFG0_01375 [Candidatus Thorarchaeota archaeon]
MRYCEECQIKHDLNIRAFKVFSESCGICNKKTTTVNFDTSTFVDHDVKAVIFKKSVKVQIGRRFVDIMITKFSNLEE